MKIIWAQPAPKYYAHKTGRFLGGVLYILRTRTEAREILLTGQRGRAINWGITADRWVGSGEWVEVPVREAEREIQRRLLLNIVEEFEQWQEWEAART